VLGIVPGSWLVSNDAPDEEEDSCVTADTSDWMVSSVVLVKVQHSHSARECDPLTSAVSARRPWGSLSGDLLPSPRSGMLEH